MAKKKLRGREELQQQIDKFADTHDGIADLHALAAKLVSEGVWQDPDYDPVRACQKALANAARNQTVVDPQGREVRKRHAFTFVDKTGQRRWLWTDLTRGTPEQIHKSLQARRRGAFGEVYQIHLAKESFNDNNNYGAQIKMSFNFDEDISEMDHPTEYPDRPDGDG